MPPRRSSAEGQPSIAGKRIFVSSCATCHGLDGHGGEHAPDIATPPEVRQLSDGEIFRIVQNGISSRGMPPFGSLGTLKIKAVVSYLRALQGIHGVVSVPGNPQRGRVLFFGQARCSNCHMVRGQGGFIGRDLTRYAQRHSPQEIRNAILNPEKDPGAGTVTAVTRDGRKYTGIARNEDNFSLQLQTPDGKFHLLMKSELAALRHEPQSLMPSDYGSRLSARDLGDLVSYLVKCCSGGS